MKIISSITLAMVAAITLDVQAATVLWDESIDGSSAGLPTLTLASGSNEILGSSRWIGDTVDPFIFTERDWYNLVLSNGLMIVSIASEILNPVWVTTDPPASYGAEAQWTLQDSGNQFLWDERTRLGESAPHAGTNVLPIGADGSYLLNQSASLSGIGSWDISWDYRVVIEVRAVPLPASVWLLLPALAAFGFLSKRKS